MFRKLLDRGEAGDNVGALLRGVDREGSRARPESCVKPGSVKPHTDVRSRGLYPDERRRRSSHTVLRELPPAVLLPYNGRDGHCSVLPEGTEMVMPGDNLKFNVELIAPIAMEDGLRFAIREGGRTVGAGVVSKIVK